MNLIRRGFLLCSLPALFACGCNVFLNPCANVTCDAGEVCVNGECVTEAECQTDADCDAGEVCDEATNTCVECDGAADCNDADACTADSCAGQACVNAPIACLSAATCPDGCGVACTLGFCTD